MKGKHDDRKGDAGDPQREPRRMRVLDEDPRDARIHDYLDGELSIQERRSFEADLARDPELAARAEALESLVTALGELPSEALLPADLWPQIQERMSVQPLVLKTSWYRTPGVGWAVAAVLALAFVAGGRMWQTARVGPAATGPVASAPVVPGAVVPVSDAAALANPTLDAGYAQAVQGLMDIYEQGRDQLDPETVEVLDQSLQTIDQAINEAVEALAQDPAGDEIRRILQRSMKRKLDMLRQVAVVVQDQA